MSVRGTGSCSSAREFCPGVTHALSTPIPDLAEIWMSSWTWNQCCNGAGPLGVAGRGERSCTQDVNADGGCPPWSRRPCSARPVCLPAAGAALPVAQVNRDTEMSVCSLGSALCFLPGSPASASQGPERHPPSAGIWPEQPLSPDLVGVDTPTLGVPPTRTQCQPHSGHPALLHQPSCVPAQVTGLREHRTGRV